MNNFEIDRILSANVDSFCGVYSCDTLPKTASGLIVCNTDPYDRPGEHWIAMYVDDECGEYFDSFGHPPNKVFKDFLNKHCTKWIFNDRQLQSICSRFCGHYCRNILMMTTFDCGEPSNPCRAWKNGCKNGDDDDDDDDNSISCLYVF